MKSCQADPSCFPRLHPCMAASLPSVHKSVHKSSTQRTIVWHVQILCAKSRLKPSMRCPTNLHQQKKFHLMYYIHISLYLLVIPSLPIPPIPHTFMPFSQTPYGCQVAQLLSQPSPVLCFCLLPHVSLAKDCFLHN